MTTDEVNRKYKEASWLIAKLSASAAGKALMFSSESLGDAAGQIAAVYGLAEDEIVRLGGVSDGGVVGRIQKTAISLLGKEPDPDENHGMKVVRTVIENGQAGRTIAKLLKVGPQAAQATSVAGRGTAWGWIAAAGYAVGSAGWFAYNARAFNLAAFEFVCKREGIDPTIDPSLTVPEDQHAPITSQTSTSRAGSSAAAAAIASRAGDLTGAAGTTVLNRLRRPRS